MSIDAAFKLPLLIRSAFVRNSLAPACSEISLKKESSQRYVSEFVMLSAIYFGSAKKHKLAI